MNEQVWELEDLLRIPGVETEHGFDISPDGTRVAFSWNPSGRWQIYEISLEHTDPPGQLTFGPGAKLAPRWSPDGKHLLYAVDLTGGEVFDLYLFTLETGKIINLTPDTPEAIQPHASWSPDSQRIAYISDHAGRYDTYIMPITGGRGEPVLSLDNPDWIVRWSPDGRWLTVVSESIGQQYGTFIVSVTGEETIVVGLNGTPISAKGACWAPDSKRIAFSSNISGYYNIGILELETRQITWVTAGKKDKEFPTWSTNGRQLAYILSDGPTTWLAVHSLENETPTIHQIEPGVHHGPQFTPNGKKVVFIFDNPIHPPDLWLLSLSDKKAQQLSRSYPPESNLDVLVMPQLVRYPGFDREMVPALLYKPSSGKALPPAVLTIHGGPNWLSQITWEPLIQHMVSRGWIVLAPNYRGSTGYGRKWQLASRFDFGGVDTRDVVAGADYLAREKIADPDRIAVTGRSWGGYLTMTSLTQYPERWAAGSAVVPFLNWFTGHENSREDLKYWDRENFGSPEENHDLWVERSPFFFLDRISAPVQLICGAHDPRCPASESIQAHDKLVALGKRCDLMLYPDEGHRFLRVENIVDARKRQVDFLASVLEKQR